MKYRKLRIVWSVTCSILSILLIVFWVRSYYAADVILWSVTKWRGLQFTSQQGQLDAQRCNLDGAGHHGGMNFSTGPIGSFGKAPTTLGFNLRHLPFYIAFPYWAPVVICMGLAAVPFIIKRYQRFQLGVRTLLIATTIVEVVLGLAVFAATH
jgi:hypothetical protein